MSRWRPSPRWKSRMKLVKAAGFRRVADEVNALRLQRKIRDFDERVTGKSSGDGATHTCDPQRMKRVLRVLHLALGDAPDTRGRAITIAELQTIFQAEFGYGSEATITRGVADLVDAGLAELVPRRDERKGGKGGNRYRIWWSNVTALAHECGVQRELFETDPSDSNSGVDEAAEDLCQVVSTDSDPTRADSPSAGTSEGSRAAREPVPSRSSDPECFPAGDETRAEGPAHDTSQSGGSWSHSPSTPVTSDGSTSAEGPAAIPHGAAAIPHQSSAAPHGEGSTPHGEGSIPHGEGLDRGSAYSRACALHFELHSGSSTPSSPPHGGDERPPPTAHGPPGVAVAEEEVSSEAGSGRDPTWSDVRLALRSYPDSVSATRLTVQAAREGGWTPAGCLRLIAWASRQRCCGILAWGGGALRLRLSEGHPDEPVDHGWLPPSPAYARAVREQELARAQARKSRQEAGAEFVRGMTDGVSDEQLSRSAYGRAVLAKRREE